MHHSVYLNHLLTPATIKKNQLFIGFLHAGRISIIYFDSNQYQVRIGWSMVI